MKTTQLTLEPKLTMQEILNASSQLSRYSAGDFRLGREMVPIFPYACRQHYGLSISKWGHCTYPQGTKLLWKDDYSLLLYQVVEDGLPTSAPSPVRVSGNKLEIDGGGLASNVEYEIEYMEIHYIIKKSTDGVIRVSELLE